MKEYLLAAGSRGKRVAWLLLQVFAKPFIQQASGRSNSVKLHSVRPVSFVLRACPAPVFVAPVVPWWH